MDFTAIDFETASRRPDSACQLGMVQVRGGQIVDQAVWLICPKPLYFHRTNIEIHGITPDQVREEPDFGELWPEIAARVGDDCLVAHNASFDMRVLLASLRSHRQTVPELTYTCTRAIAKRTWPHQRRFGLKPLSTWLGIRFRHHDALEDSVACAKILLAAAIDREAKSLGELEKRLRLRRGKAGPWGTRGPTGSTSRRRRESSGSTTPAAGLPFLMPNEMASPKRVAERSQSTSNVDPNADFDLQRLMIRAGFIRPLAGKTIVLAGRFRVLSDGDVCRLAENSGATCQESINESTDLVVIGDESKPAARAKTETSAGGEATTLKEEAESRKAGGQQIRVVSEAEFLSLVDSRAT